MKSIIRSLLVVMLLSSTAFAGNVFPDVDETFTPYFRGIEFLAEENIVGGYPDGTYRPWNTLNRAEMLKIIAEGAAIYYEWDENIYDSYASKDCFPDVPANVWYTKYVCYGKEKGWVKGYDDGSFKPEQTVTFVEGLKITLQGFDIDYDADTSPWYKGMVDTAGDSNYIPWSVEGFSEALARDVMADLVTRIIKENDEELDEYLVEGGVDHYMNVDYEVIELGGIWGWYDYMETVDEQAGDGESEDDDSADTDTGTETATATEDPEPEPEPEQSYEEYLAELEIILAAMTLDDCQDNYGTCGTQSLCLLSDEDRRCGELWAEEYERQAQVLQEEFEVFEQEITDLVTAGTIITWDEYYALEDQLNDKYSGMDKDYSSWDNMAIIRADQIDPESNPKITGTTWITDSAMSGAWDWDHLDLNAYLSGDISLSDTATLYFRNSVIKVTESDPFSFNVNINDSSTFHLRDTTIEADAAAMPWSFNDNATIILDNVTVEGGGSWYTAGPNVTITEIN